MELGCCNTSVETALKLVAVKVAADKDEAGFTLFVVLPWTLMISFNDHVHALYHITLCVTFEGNDALQAENVRAVCLGDLLNPWKEAVGIHFTRTQRD